MAYWTDNNAEKGWDDFLLAVKQRFDPDPYADYAGPVRKPHTSTSDLLTWSEAPSPAVSSTANALRADQQVDGICKVLFDGQITDENAENLNKRKPCSGYKLKEMNGSKRFAGDSGDGSTESGASDGNFKHRTSVRIVQQAPIIAGDSGHPRLLGKQKIAGFDETSDSDSDPYANAQYDMVHGWGDDDKLDIPVISPRFMYTGAGLGIFCLKGSLEELFRSVTSGMTYCRPKILAGNLNHLSPTFKVGQQEDAHEFLFRLWNKLMACDKNQASVWQVFGGSVVNNNLIGALETHTETTVADFRCGTCGKEGVTQKIELDKLSPIATFHLKRFDRSNNKIKKHVLFPPMLDLLPSTSTDKVTYPFACPVERHFNSELYAIVVHEGDASKAGHYYSFFRLNSNERYRYDDSQVSAVDEEEVFKQMAYILFYTPHGTTWFTNFILALHSSNGFTSLVASQLLSTFELRQGDETALTHGKEGNGSETDRYYIRPETTISFVPDSTERCQDVSLGGENGAGKADKDPSLSCEKNKAVDGVLLGKFDDEILISWEFVSVSACVADVEEPHYYAHAFFNLLQNRLRIMSRASVLNLLLLLLSESRPWAFKSVVGVVVLFAYLQREAVVLDIRPSGSADSRPSGSADSGLFRKGASADFDVVNVDASGLVEMGICWGFGIWTGECLALFERMQKSSLLLNGETFLTVLEVGCNVNTIEEMMLISGYMRDIHLDVCLLHDSNPSHKVLDWRKCLNVIDDSETDLFPWADLASNCCHGFVKELALKFVLDKSSKCIGNVMATMPQSVSLGSNAIGRLVIFLRERRFAIAQVWHIMILSFGFYGPPSDNLMAFLDYFHNGGESTRNPRHKLVAWNETRCTPAWLLNCSTMDFEDPKHYDSMDSKDLEVVRKRNVYQESETMFTNRPALLIAILISTLRTRWISTVGELIGPSSSATPATAFYDERAARWQRACSNHYPSATARSSPAGARGGSPRRNPPDTPMAISNS